MPDGALCSYHHHSFPMRNATLIVLTALAVVIAPRAAAQCTGTEGVDFERVTLREVNALPQSNIDALNAGGADLTTDQINENVASPFNGERVEFSAVILSDPLKSGLGSPSSTGAPNRYHTFVRDTAADTDGVAGMGGQLVDGDGISVGAITDFFVGDEVTVCGTVSFFGATSQINPESITSNSNPRSADDPILDPVVVTTDDIHDSFMVNGEARSQVDWSVYPDFVNQYVRFETIELVQGVTGTNGRPNMLFSTNGDDTTIRSYDTSVCFRNDRKTSSYYPGGDVPQCVANGDFVPPATGIVNVQGFLTMSGTFDAFSSTVPSGGAFAINPIEEEDFEIAAAPPIITAERNLATVADGALIRATVVPGTAGNTVASVTADYTTSSGGSGQVTLSNTSGDTYEGTITGLAAGEFVTYTISAVDNQNLSTPATSPVTLRVVDGPVSSIFDVQVTPDGGPGASALITSEPVAFDLDAVVQTAYQTGTRYQVTIQDDESLSAFSGVLLDFGSTDPGLAVGDQINISEARVSEFNDGTQLVNVSFTKTGSGDPYPAKVVTTNLFNGSLGAETAEQHEGMLLRFEDVEITSTNPDEGSGNFGEFAFSSDGTAANQLRADDASNEIASDFNSTLTVGQKLAAIEGYLSYSFGNYKLIPTELADIEFAVAVGHGPEATALRILGAYPNPASSTVGVRFELDAAGPATLALYDVTGRQVATLAQGTFAADTHEASADLGGLAAGVYVLRLEAAGEVATARIAVVR